MSSSPSPGVEVAAGDEDLADLYEQAPCGYLSIEPGGRIVRINRVLADWLGSEPGALAGQQFQDLLPIAGKIYFETHFVPLLRMQGHFDEVALELIGPDGRRLPVLANARERRDADGQLRFIRIAIFVASDRRRYEKELLEARRQADMASVQLRELTHTLETRVAEEVAGRMEVEEALRQAQKMEAIGQLTGGVAHDFNNLLTIIMGGLDSIERQFDSLPDPKAMQRLQRAVNMAQRGAERAATLTARLLAFGRRQPLNPKPVDAGRLVTGLADMLQRTLGATVAFETVCGAGLWLATVDPGQLENALINLTINARDAMPRGGHLTIETSNASLDEAYVASVPEPVSPGQYVLVAVSDTGHGMDEAAQQRAFEPFYTTKDIGKGTGLGLSQVYGFVRQTGGHVRIYSELGQGTTVRLYLPRYHGDARAEVAGKLPQLTEFVASGETILLVEDHDDLRAFSRGILEDLGYRVLEAADAQSALDLLAAEQDVALLFTDVVLPGGKDGKRLAEEARRMCPGLKVLFTTGYTRNAIVHNGRLDAGVTLISKPFTASALSERVREMLDRRETAPDAGR
ncbi:MAG TPA: ATP-binding protein [Rhodanobacter sp.]|nr:ATP-binding protein [Rhodanobacter sp.]